MKKFLPCIMLLLLSHAVQANEPQGKQAFAAIKACIMRNDNNYCRSLITEGSKPLYDRFSGYKLMPCLPTDFAYASEEKVEDRVIVKATMPASINKIYNLRLVFRKTGDGLKLDIPESFHLGMGENWQNKVQLSEQVYLMMKQNLGDKLNCDMLNNILQGQ